MQRRVILLTAVPLVALTGCVAVAVPVLAGGAMVRSVTVDKDKDKAARAVPAAPQRPTPDQAAVSAPSAASTTPVVPLPAFEARTAQVGQLYRGSLPPPGPAPMPAAPATEPAQVAAAATWADVGHHVAADLSPEHGMLPVRGSPANAPRWTPCGDKPLAVLAGASTVFAPGTGGAPRLDPAARSWVGALRVMSVATVIVAGDQAQAAAVRAAFAAADLPVPVDGDTLLVTTSDRMPATRAAMGAHYCVLAIAGRAAADFPYGLTPDTTPAPMRGLWGRGWFLLPGAAG